MRKQYTGHKKSWYLKILHFLLHDLTLVLDILLTALDTILNLCICCGRGVEAAGTAQVGIFLHWPHISLVNLSHHGVNSLLQVALEVLHLRFHGDRLSGASEEQVWRGSRARPGLGTKNSGPREAAVESSPQRTQGRLVA